MKQKIFEDFDFSGFWDNDEYALEKYIGQNPTKDMISWVESELGYKLPTSYIELMQLQNGGTPLKTCFSLVNVPSTSLEYIQITGIMGIGKDKTYSLCGELGSKFWIEEWGYPDIGVYICGCPSAGHEMILLDYSKCGEQGEPEVAYIDQESDYVKVTLAKDFETFIRGLESDEEFQW